MKKGIIVIGLILLVLTSSGCLEKAEKPTPKTTLPESVEPVKIQPESVEPVEFRPELVETLENQRVKVNTRFNAELNKPMKFKTFDEMIIDQERSSKVYKSISDECLKGMEIASDMRSIAKNEDEIELVTKYQNYFDNMGKASLSFKKSGEMWITAMQTDDVILLEESDKEIDFAFDYLDHAEETGLY